MRYDLAQPVTGTAADGTPTVLLDHLDLRLPCAQDIVDARGKEGPDSVVFYVARLSGQPEALIRRLGLEDFSALDDIATAFFAEPQKAGAKRAKAFLARHGISAPTGDSSPQK